MGERGGRPTEIAEVEEGFNLRPMRRKLEQFGGQERQKQPPTIYRVPHWIRKDHEDAYEPRIVSIGPYHHNNPRLVAMEEHKWRYLHDFLFRNDKRLEDCIKEIKELEEKARSSYAETVCLVKDVKTSEDQARSTEITLLPKSESEAFVEMLVLDGCFLIELLHKNNDDRLFEDPMYTAKWVLPCIANDMMLLENQLPFFILQQLFNLIRKPPCSLVELAYKFFSHWFYPIREPQLEEVFHLLHLSHLQLQPNKIESTRKKPPSFCSQLLPVLSIPCATQLKESGIKFKLPVAIPCATQLKESGIKCKLPVTIPCATQLKESGIKFKKGEEGDNFLEVKFIKGVLILPPFVFQDYTESYFRNLVAFEQCCPTHAAFTAYAAFLYFLINTSDDVQILVEKGIIENVMGSEKEVVELFNNICNNIFIDIRESYLAEFFQEVSIYCANSCNKWRAKLMHDYFNNPWSFLSLVAATVLLILTLFQTVFSGIPIFKDSPSPP
ncbi:UPF0481 protein At3g47200-like [Tasmannia lanceolata]|uniref:UPF0481 protein At3g47200-like n=1 Tax=Tasmannia lanceolata TaxID=3420 RepID=UPI0040628727